MFTQIINFRADLTWLDRIRPFGIDLFCTGKKFLLLNLINRALKLKYRKSSIGIFWTMLTPILMSITYIVIFQYVVRLQVENYSAYIIAGVLPWALFSQSVFDSMDSVIQNYGILAKVPMPFHVFPLSVAAVSTINFIIALPVILAVCLYSNPHFGPYLLFLPILIGFFFLLCYCFGLVFSVATVYYRDIKHVFAIFLQVWMYGTPILYTPDMIPEQFRWVLFANPFTGLVVNFRDVVLYGQMPQWNYFGATLLWVAFALIVASLVIRSQQHKIVEAV